MTTRHNRLTSNENLKGRQILEGSYLRFTPAIRKRNPQAGNDQGSILVLTFIFLILVSLVVVTLSNWTASGLQTTRNFQNASNNLYAASGVTQLAIRSTRYTYPSGTSTTDLHGVCPGTPSPVTVNNVSIQDFCDTVLGAGTIFDRQVTFSACQTSVSLGSVNCASPLLTVVVNYDDNPNGSVPSNPDCSFTVQTDCGAYMAIVSWRSS